MAREAGEKTMKSYLNWGIMGAAKIAREHLAPAIALAEGARLTALATQTPGRDAPYHRFAPDLTVHDSYDALLADPNVDAVYIPLPNSMHVDWTRRALEAGKHVLCEKPLAMSTAEIDPLIALRDRTGLLAAEGFMVVHHPQWQRVRSLLAEGAIGTLRHVDAAFSFNNTDLTNIRNRPEMGGGALPDIGVYPSVTTRFATGQEPHRLRADIQWENGVDTFARVWADFDSFTMAFYVGIRHAARQSILFHGSEGTIELLTPFNARVSGEARLRLRRGYNHEVVERFEPVDQYQLMIEAFNRSVLSGEPFACPLEFSRGNQQMIDAIFTAGGR